MTHLGFVATAYGLGIAVPLAFTLAAVARLRLATRRLAAIDPRQNRRLAHGGGE
ncbi:hypothetical protein [Rhodopila sp.]|uniref:hypothetical protein n=1 Tax=Rhodopila sp. TaxID=2480087 RepID=UPI002C782756|nr:hypothetical protein [Rhodopila sp.]HVZ08655.1 hypothetical protein [Rhodopila sp.]